MAAFYTFYGCSVPDNQCQPFLQQMFIKKPRM